MGVGHFHLSHGAECAAGSLTVGALPRGSQGSWTGEKWVFLCEVMGSQASSFRDQHPMRVTTGPVPLQIRKVFPENVTIIFKPNVGPSCDVVIGFLVQFWSLWILFVWRSALSFSFVCNV